MILHLMIEIELVEFQTDWHSLGSQEDLHCAKSEGQA